MQGNELTVGQLPCGVCRARRDEQLTLLEANDSFYQLYGYTREEAERAGFCSIEFISYAPDWDEARGHIEDELTRGSGEFELEFRCAHCADHLLWVLARLRVMDDGSLLAVMVDITERRCRMEQLQLTKEESRLALEHTGRFFFRYNLDTGCCTLSENTAWELGLPALVEDVPESMIERGHVDGESVEEYRNFFNGIKRGEPRGDMLVRLRNHTGDFTWYHCMFSQVCDEEGVPRHAVVSFEDFSQQREREIAYEKWSQYNRRQMAEAMVYYESNLTHNLFEAVEGGEAGLIPQDVRGSYEATIQYAADNLVDQEDRKKYQATFARDVLLSGFQQGRREAHLEYRRKNEAGQYYWASTSVQLLPDPYSGDIKAFALVRSIDQQKRREMEMERLSRTDTLTGLLNRGATIEAVEHVLQTSGPSARHAFLMMDIDCFKELNDTMGHRFGDQVLESIAQGLRRSLRSGDVVGRLGGDEFVIFLRDMPLGKALEQKLITICSLLSGLFAKETLVSGSLGVAVYPRDGVSFDELYQKADIALYQAKRGGRNQFMFYQPSMEQEDWKPHNDTPIDRELEPQMREDPYWLVRREAAAGGASLENVESYLRAVRDSVDDVIVMDVTRDAYYLAFSIPNKYRMPETDGTLRDFLLQMSHQIHPGDSLRFAQFFDRERVRAALHSGRRSLYSEFRKMRQSGSYCWVSMSLVPMDRYSGEEIYLCFVRDIDAHKQEQERWSQERLDLCRQIEAESYRTIMEEAGTILLEYNAETGSSYSSPAARKFTLETNVDGRGAFQIFTPQDVHPEDWHVIDEIVRQVSQGQGSAGGTARLRCVAGGYLWCDVTLTVLRGEDGSFHRSLVAINDVDESVKNRQELVYRAEYDELTEYRNFTKFKADAVGLLEHRGPWNYGLFYCDLRSFKLINDMYGYDFGDRVLRYWANVLARQCGEGEIFARVSADHFTVLCRYKERGELAARFNSIAELLAGYGELAGKKLRLELVGGIYCIEAEEDILSVQDMIDRANLAQKSVKQMDGSRYAFYSAAMREELLWEKEMEADMHRALAAGEFVPYFQPIVKINGEETVHTAEALARWEKPGRGLVPPGEFIPLFEKNGFIVELDLYIFEESCRILQGWIQRGYPTMRVAVNVSRVSVFQPDFEARYLAVKEKYGIPHGMIGLECTESTAVQNAEGLDRIMSRMRGHGFEFSMDDFGSGYSSLNLLKDVHAGILKLDMMFLRHNELQEARNKTIVSSILRMASALDMETVAEGVETEEQLNILRQLGCDYAQGFLFSPPVPAKLFAERFLRGKVIHP